MLPSLRDLQRVLPEQQNQGQPHCMSGPVCSAMQAKEAGALLPKVDSSGQITTLERPGQQKIVPSRHLILRFFLGQHAHLWVLLIKFLQGDYNVSCACL